MKIPDTSLALRWKRFVGGSEAEQALLGNVPIALITPMSVAPGMWAYKVDGVDVKWLAKPTGRVKGKASARRAVQRAWSAWLEDAGLLGQP